MAVLREARAMIAGMDPRLTEGDFVFCALPDEATAARAHPVALGWFREDEGSSAILESPTAAALGLDPGPPMRRITLMVASGLDGVGLTAAVASALAREAIPCNMVAAFHHDHVFVPAALATRALAVLQAVQAKAAASP